MSNNYAINLKGIFFNAFNAVGAKHNQYTLKDIAELETHGCRVSSISANIAEQMGCSSDMIADARLCGLFHDIGKFYIEPSILNKRDDLTDAEFAQIKEHVIYSKKTMEKMGLFEYADIVLFHHERIDGSGYFGLKSNQIPLISKIVGLADVYDALSSDRAYRKACKKETVLNIIHHEKHKFDEDIYRAFMKLYGAK